MTHLIDKSALVAEIEKLKLCTMDEHMKFYSESAEGEYNALCNIEHFIDSLQEEPVSENLGDYINELSKQFPEVSFAKLSRIAVRVAKWQKEQIKKALDLGEPPYLISVEQAYYRTLKLLEE